MLKCIKKEEAKKGFSCLIFLRCEKLKMKMKISFVDPIAVSRFLLCNEIEKEFNKFGEEKYVKHYFS